MYAPILHHNIFYNIELLTIVQHFFKNMKLFLYHLKFTINEKQIYIFFLFSFTFN